MRFNLLHQREQAAGTVSRIPKALSLVLIFVPMVTNFPINTDCTPEVRDPTLFGKLLTFMAVQVSEAEVHSWRVEHLSRLKMDILTLENMIDNLRRKYIEHPPRVRGDRNDRELDVQLLQSLPITIPALIDIDASHFDVHHLRTVVGELMTTFHAATKVIGKLYDDEEAYASVHASSYIQQYAEIHTGLHRAACGFTRLLNSLLSPGEVRRMLESERIEDEEIDRVLGRQHTHSRFVRDYRVLVHVRTLLDNSVGVILEILKGHSVQF